jgi:hypothetical protein
MEGRLRSKTSGLLSIYTGKHEVEDATSRFHASLAFRRALVAGLSQSEDHIRVREFDLAERP